MICPLTNQKLIDIVNADITFSVFRKELPYFLEGAGQPEEHKVHYCNHL